jgi:2'-hydroxyisoflavone reductase
VSEIIQDAEQDHLSQLVLCCAGRMQILVLGGTKFVGKHIVFSALAQGHSVTVFTRGQTPDDLPEAVQRLHGNRDGDLDSLHSGTWDACIDVSGYQPGIVRQSAETLRGRVGRYLFISTVSVYAPGERAVTTEDSPLCELPDPAVAGAAAPKRTERGVTAPAGLHETYGELKVLCERVVGEVYGDQATIVRPHIVAGPGDHTGRFTYWAEALAAGGKVLAPGDGPDSALNKDKDNEDKDTVQYIDARDLADFVVHLIEHNQGGTFHTAVPPMSWQAFLTGIARGVDSQPELIWTPAADLRARGLDWNKLPLFLPQAEDDTALMRTDCTRAVSAGLRCRSVEETAHDTFAWSQGLPADQRPVAAPVEREPSLQRP